VEGIVEVAVLLPFRGLFYHDRLASEWHRLVAFPPDPFVQRRRTRSGALPARHVSRLLNLIQQRRIPAVRDLQQLFHRWEQEDVFQEDRAPALYLTEERFRLGSTCRTRTMLYALVKTPRAGSLETVVPHEKTDPKRLARFAVMWKAFRASLSPVFALYEDPQGDLRHLIRALERRRTLMRVIRLRPPFGGDYTCALYRLDHPADIQRLVQAFAQRLIFIADGHHRYEAALQAGMSGVLMGLIAVEDPGLLVLPIHRLARIPAADWEGWRRRLVGMFRVTTDRAPDGKIPKRYIQMVTSRSRERLTLPHPSEGNLGLLFALQQMLEGYPVDFTVESDVAFHVTKGGYSHGFLVPPLEIQDILRVARHHGILPVKSTYFFPKLLSGLVMARLPT